MEAYDDTDYSPFKELDQQARDELVQGEAAALRGGDEGGSSYAR